MAKRLEITVVWTLLSVIAHVLFLNVIGYIAKIHHEYKKTPLLKTMAKSL